jgi:putative sterol carrier protein
MAKEPTDKVKVVHGEMVGKEGQALEKVGRKKPLAKTQPVSTKGTDEYLQLIIDAARDPSVDVEKLKTLLEMKERMLMKVAEGEYNQAMSIAQGEMTRVGRDAKNPQTQSRYASYAALDKVLRPIYTKHGFSLSFDTAESPLPEHVRILCDVAHKAGFKSTKHIDMPNDGKGAKGGDVMTKTHATGAGVTYGMRYLLKMIFNVAIGEDDTDGNRPTGGGGQDHRYPSKGNEDVRAPQSKSERAAATNKPADTATQSSSKPATTEKVAQTTRPTGGIEPAPDAVSRVTASNVKTLKSLMTRAGITEDEFDSKFGFKIEYLDKKDLGPVADWIKENGK